ncbi:hypothetical protein [Prochlorococcus marinus]|uniref:hypothetical protein n=1 Tax=Prochlorococcus marinus TaxID=1219 RepID=UPI0027D9043C|nr:hypothetical protein [Prochlorococcus marinus]
MKKFLFIFTFNLSLFLILFLGIQNSKTKKKVNLIIGETVYLPISFIVGGSFISGSITGGLLNINMKGKKE